MKRVLMSDELFDALGASKVEWGEPDTDGFYSPTVYADTTEATLRTALALAHSMIHSGEACSDGSHETIRAALQQPAVQPRGSGPPAKGPNHPDRIAERVAEYGRTAQPEGGPE